MIIFGSKEFMCTFLFELGTLHVKARNICNIQNVINDILSIFKDIVSK